MTLKEAYNFFESLKTQTTQKSEMKIYEKFLHILSELKFREFSKDEVQSIETELDSLNLNSNPTNRKRYFRKVLRKFESYLKHTFSLTSKGYYTNLGIALGSSFGVLLGVVFLSSFERSLGIALALIVGMLIGLTIGRYMDSKVEATGSML